jgi:crotonobetainyl-CoA:carnitine CoA-transferase CaiB-like acyl-CoA transferase
MVYDCESEVEVTLTLTKKELYEARMAILMMANIKAEDKTPTAQKRVQEWDALVDKLARYI